MEVFALNEMQTKWTLEETKSMYEITKDNIYKRLKDKFEQRIDIILTGEEDLFSVSKPGGFGSYYDSEMAKKIVGKSTYKEISDKIKKVWNDKILSRLYFTPDLQSAYDEFKKIGKIPFGDEIKNSWDLVNSALEDGSEWTGKGSPYLNEYLSLKSTFYKTKTENLLTQSGIDSDQEYMDIFKKLSSVKNKSNEFPFKNKDLKLKSEFFEYYRHYHFWLFANLIMNGKTNTVLSSTSTKPKSSTSSVTTPTRERRTVDRVSVGQTISDL
jgi:hypothetical protein